MKVTVNISKKFATILKDMGYTPKQYLNMVLRYHWGNLPYNPKRRKSGG